VAALSPMHLSFFCLETKETKIQGDNFLCYKIKISSKRFELATLKQQIFFNASIFYFALRNEV